MKTSRALKASRRLREGFAKASAIPTEASWSLLEGFAKAPRPPSFGNDSSDNDKPPSYLDFLKKNLNASRPILLSKMSKRLGGIIDRLQIRSLFMAITLGQQYNTGEKPTVIL